MSAKLRILGVTAALLSFAVAGCTADAETVALSGSAATASESTTVSAAEPEVQPETEVAASAATTAPPVVTFETLREPVEIPFTKEVQATDDLDLGVKEVAQAGRAGIQVKVIRVRLVDGVEVARRVLRKVVKREPQSRIVLRGTYVEPPEPESSCDSNYAGACVPIASDVDCGGGSGDGPGYVYGVVEVVGSDVYDLDRDGDGYGCD